MSSAASFQMLKNLAADEEDKALREMAEVNAQFDHSSSQLRMLEQYRHDYLEKLQQTLVSGTRSSIAANTQRFIDNIDMAIVKQKAQVQVVEKKVEQQHAHWMEQRRKTQSMSALLDRQEARERLSATRLEQKQNDEFAIQSYRRMKSTQ